MSAFATEDIIRNKKLKRQAKGACINYGYKPCVCKFVRRKSDCPVGIRRTKRRPKGGPVA